MNEVLELKEQDIEEETITPQDDDDGVEWELQEPTSDTWLPEKVGDQLTGLIIDERESQYGGIQYQVKTPQDEAWWTPSHSALQSRLKETGEGDLVKIEYRGEEPTNKGNPVKIYKVWKARTG